jgi:hypothetical protein
MNAPKDSSFAALVATPLHALSGTEWDDFYAAIVPFVSSANKSEREQAVERLSMAVLWSERSSAKEARNEGITVAFDAAARLNWLLTTITNADKIHADVIAMFLSELKYKDVDKNERGLVLQWLNELMQRPPPNLPPDVIEGTIILVESHDEENAAEVARLIEYLDHQSNYIRACAARQLSGMEGDAANRTHLFALIKEKELIRPGIAGPFWSQWQFMRESAPVDPIEWMMDILERRSGPEPQDAPFNGIDFYLHEICDSSPETVSRMIKGGHIHLAIETATELQSEVPSMAPVLRELADRTEQDICTRAQIHLARFYRERYPKHVSFITHHPNWSEGADLLIIFARDMTQVSSVILNPIKQGAEFDDGIAWSLIDRAMPPALRGEPAHHPLESDRQHAPKPFALRDRILCCFAAGAYIELHGNVEQTKWNRIEVSAGRLGAAWNTFLPLGT